MPTPSAANFRARAIQARRIAENMRNEKSRVELRRMAAALDAEADQLESLDPTVMPGVKGRRMPGWVGRREREPASVGGAVILPDLRRIPATIIDVSDEGCQVECSEPLPIGSTVQLEVEACRITAVVRWSLQNRTGLRFEE